jgi:hypothetical protein
VIGHQVALEPLERGLEVADDERPAGAAVLDDRPERASVTGSGQRRFPSARRTATRMPIMGGARSSSDERRLLLGVCPGERGR